ncbi:MULTISPECIES: MobF family relaxase [unclassified Microbacterium]|uniref:MobF family relaxase n=1 Tax=unclassified Microbacterium TaxID=2609290 RepID=UPI0024692F56|nr:MULTISPECIES: MobF family relaxase [unclassified Microbacterium]MDH5134304.1 MobF family relaxase [Microbacterium sp. RD10]MDH5137689.1 MobF family relaxase [Microbacterium sp. RD11]MDH5145493.1 MobF family relaxase [Microbacterium sp. RD12]MDH5155757.1 MobF family relaxase [Microbacterium sp. RD06]MDH5166424.1 MobF family relaxase [Microbacterium sp. RD02]
MTIRVMSSGKGYEYLLKSVVVGDGDREMSSSLTRYYTETGNPPGTWVGTGLISLDDGLTPALAEGDTVTEEHLARLLGDGIHPVTGDKLGKGFPSLQPPRERIAARVARLDPDLRGEARAEAVERIREEEVAKKPRTAVAGFDLTFSPPKSVSAIWGVADAGTQALITQAHHAAMRDTIALLEDRVAATRVGAGGIAQMPIVGVIATAFDHYDSRAADPQLHTHVVVSNKVQGEDGCWRTLDSRRLHKAAVALSESYNAFVTDHTARLLGVTWVPVDRGKDRNTGWEIEGVPAALIAEFSRRTTGVSDGAEGIEQVKNRLIEQYVAEHGRQPSAATIAKFRQQATLETRPEKELHSLADLTADWRARAEVVLGEDAPTWAQYLLDRGATEARLRADDLGLEQIEDLASVVLMEVANRRATWGRFNLHAETMRQIMGVRFATTDDRIRVLDQIIAHAEAESLRLTPDYDRAVPAHYVDGEGNRFQLVDQIAYSSQDILDAEQRLLAHSQRTGGPALTARLVARHTSRKISGVRLDPDQAVAITRIARSVLTLDLLVGPAGSGKTTALRALYRAWTAAHGRDSVIGLAPSAAAAEVLGNSLGVRAENTAKFLYEHHHGRWNLEAGQLVLVDESSLAGTLALDRIAEHAAEVGAKVVLIGDWAQLSAVETGGAFGMLVRHRDQVPELTDVRRFANEWEKTASLGLRHGNTDALDEYQERGRLLDGDAETMLDAIYEAWRTDRDEGLRTLMIAGTGERVAQLNERARADLIEAGQVEADGLRLHDGTTAGIGDLVVTRLNDRRLSTGKAWVKNGDRWQVTHRYDDGSLAVRRLGRGDQPHGKALVLPAKYVREELELGYASTVHRAQGASVDTAHALVDPEASSRELFYVAMTRGKHRNHAYVIVPDSHEVEPHLDQPEPLTLIDRLAKVLARSDADLSATETIALEVDRHASLSTLLAEYDVLAREAQIDRWAALLDVAPFPENVADEVFTSPYYERLEAALARYEAAGHLAAVPLNALAPKLTPGEDQADPAAQLAAMLDQATTQLPRGRGRSRSVAGLIATPTEPINEDMQTALTDRQLLIETAAWNLVREAQEAGAAWLARLGKPPAQPRQREQWLAYAATVALYRYRYDITDPTPLGAPKSIKIAEQTAEYRAAYARVERARQLGSMSQSEPNRRHPVSLRAL